MRKRNIIGALLCSVCLIAANGVPAMADAVKVVTLGADLTEDQKNTNTIKDLYGFSCPLKCST